MLDVNKIYCTNCLNGMKQLQDCFIDLTVTSPPYDDLRDYKGFSFDFENIAKELFRITKQGGIVVWVVGDAVIDGSETGTSFKQALYFKEIGFKLHDTMIYQKNNFSFPSNNRYHQVFEYMFVLSKGKPKTVNLLVDRKNIYVGQKPHGKMRNKEGGWDAVSSSRKVKYEGIQQFGLRHNVWEYTTGGGHVTKDDIAYQHPAIFPEKLVEDHIKTWSNEGDIILDPMCGSGTTCMVARYLNRNYLGFEISEEYYNIAIERMKLTTTIDKWL